MKSLPFLLLLAAISSGLFAQKKLPVNIDQYIAKLPVLNLPPPVYSSELPQSENHFSKFTIIDYRPDANHLGTCFDPQEQQITFNRVPVKNVVDSFLNKNCSAPGSSNEVLIVLKKLWYSSTELDNPYVNYGFGSPIYTEHRGARLQFSAESYLKTDAGFVPFAAFDTIIVTKKRMKTCGSSMLAEALNALAQKLNSKNIERIIASRKPFIENAIDSMSKRNFQGKIYKEETVRKGVYMTAKEFFNNEPSIDWYEIQKSKDGMQSLYLKNEKGQLYLARSIWGFCDGEKSYVMMNDNLFPIYKNGNAFFVIGSKLYQVRKLSSSPTGSPTGALTAAIVDDLTPNTIKERRLFTLDAMTGEVW
ncbi:hypothetical protein [Pinibacter aurantiacus]|uniref:Uncharacterized protein n=1 Tax=Pinibacter aurantiacus TaxID=2851599 RepID=A0A9E2SDG4_9BACT|nr:hypothetical protein [Pinibacter aurantiacus]MBV4360102.1 hypothetical protein [Pinibacter aurantiacus]